MNKQIYIPIMYTEQLIQEFEEFKIKYRCGFIFKK